MQWLNILAVLACPLMMLLCMKGMFSGNKDEKSSHKNEPAASSNELQSLQIKMGELMEQNHKLTSEIQMLKQGKS